MSTLSALPKSINDAVNEIEIKRYKMRFDRGAEIRTLARFIRHFTKMAWVQVDFLLGEKSKQGFVLHTW